MMAIVPIASTLVGISTDVNPDQAKAASPSDRVMVRLMTIVTVAAFHSNNNTYNIVSSIMSDNDYHTDICYTSWYSN